jgi:hypothetical protein
MKTSVIKLKTYSNPAPGQALEALPDSRLWPHFPDAEAF